MDLLYFEDHQGDSTLQTELPLRVKWNDSDDSTGTVKIQRNRQRKLLGPKNSKEMHKKTLTKQLSRFHASFQNGTAFDKFESSEISETAKVDTPIIRLCSRLSSKLPIRSLSVSESSTFMTTSYKSATLYSIHDSVPLVLSNITLQAPFEKGQLCADSSSAIFYGNGCGVSIYDVSSGSFSLCRKLLANSNSKFENIQWSKHSHSLTVLSADHSVAFFDDRIFKPMSSALKGVSAICKSRDDNLFFLGMIDGCVHVHDLRKNDIVMSYSSDSGKVTSLCQSSGEGCIAGHDSGFISLFQSNSEQPLASFGNFTTSISDLTFDSLTDRLLACSEESFKSAKILNMDSQSWRHLSTTTIVPLHIRFSKFIPQSDNFVLGTPQNMAIYSFK